MTEQDLREHCTRHRIRVYEKPSGALRFVGEGVDVSTSGWKDVNIQTLEPYYPLQRRLTRQESSDMPDLAGFGLAGWR